MSDTNSNKEKLPLVSCVMPTFNRRKFVPHAINYFLAQRYENKELIIIDDGADNVEDLVPAHADIHYYRLNKKITLGAKLNLGCNYAGGEIIANWDDDDWYSSTRLLYQVEALLNNKAEVCGINNLLYYDLQNDRAYNYIYPLNQRKWLLGSSLCYTKNLWQHNRFADVNVGMDGLFVWATSPENVKVLDNSKMSVHMIHEHNISPKKTDTPWWHIYPVDELKKIMKQDWDLYKKTDTTKNIFFKPTINCIPAEKKTGSIKNIFACLVHESEECIIDLVRNLHYHDPSSVILLFNGGRNKNLFTNTFPYEKFGAVIHPRSFTVRYGYLHAFALSCMDFAIKNFSFNSLTIVDSDQLAIRPGYSKYLQQSFYSSEVGMLSAKPKRITQNDKTDSQVWPAIQALNEFALWKPLLQQFSNGENKFVHWTFWPSTVFSANASKDIVKIFKENKLLIEIMKKTKIWATEEVILSTLTALMGYKIIANPCSYDFVKFKKIFSAQEVLSAFNKTNAYWIHPVNRQYHDAVRKNIRKNFNHYISIKNPVKHADAADELFVTLPLLNKIRKIGGWLNDEEADALISVTIKACTALPNPHTIVEVGSYHGKSTVLFGSVLRKFSPRGKVYAIDVHDGRLGSLDDGLCTVPPSFNSLKKNIAEADLNNIVEIFKDHSWNIIWNKPVSLLFIDGLHDYIHVSKDFWHFANWIIEDGYVVFHDYADYFPGVQALVNEILETNEYQIVCKKHSLVVLKKTNKEE